jgi:hypothetical protein
MTPQRFLHQFDCPYPQQPVKEDKNEIRHSAIYYPSPPRKLETRAPKFWVYHSGSEQYFVNDSNETLAYVDAGLGGMKTYDDDAVIPVSSAEPKYYENVLPGEAVKIDEYDESDEYWVYYGKDFVTCYSVDIESPSLGKLLLQTRLSHKPSTQVLMWEDGTATRHTSVITK